MTGSTPLEAALIVWSREVKDRQQQVDDAVALAEFGVFSNRHIAHITGLSLDFVCDLNPKHDKTGGKFNPQALPSIHDLALDAAQGGRNRQLAATIVNQGVSQSFLAKLTGISQSSISRWLEEYETEKSHEGTGNG